ncbi:fe(2+)/Mn(2+) transporter pcl1 (plasmid) [Arthrobacter sp. Hiyo8]|uniref:VIT1/CCC1 transporter family protein n=1 Tax=Arthrobacter sp. Hiyo1 TaxID=1588020 RepID=UPI00068385C8|nr:fe(2+)/Mn(2+) transporter pcl1 [Arthrobacter sp. Hiyo8]GAP60773.1 fe(2+)/Mn(2+) transporter pcl1 [Arthrobacter sp. Hiyo1]
MTNSTGDITTEWARGMHPEPQGTALAAKLNWLRAGILGANDGIVSVAAVVVGVAGVTSNTGPILAAGMAALVGGAISMALGEYVSVSSQSDSQKHLIEKERLELLEKPEEELAELVGLYRGKGLSEGLATKVAQELTTHDALGAHLDIELGIDPEEIVSPWHAALASAVSFLCGAVLPMLAILLFPQAIRVPLTFASVLVALVLTGALGAWIGGGSRTLASIRVVIGGAIALATTFALGSLLGTTGIA